MITKQMEKALEKHKGLFSESSVTDDIDVVGILLRAGDEKIAWQFVKESDFKIAQKKNKQDNTVAAVAAWNGNVWFLEKMHESGLDLSHPNISIYGARHLPVLEFLLSSGNLDVNAKGEDGFTPLQQATNVSSSFYPVVDREVEAVRLGCIEFLLQNGADVNASNDFGRTAAMSAAYIGASVILELLLRYGADASDNLRCNEGKSTLDYADGEDTVALLKGRGVKVH